MIIQRARQMSAAVSDHNFIKRLSVVSVILSVTLHPPITRRNVLLKIESTQVSPSIAKRREDIAGLRPLPPSTRARPRALPPHLALDQ